MEKVLSMHSRQSSGTLVSIIVVSCQRWDLLADCLQGVSQQSYPYIECLVFLNLAEEKDLSVWQERFPSFKFFYFSENKLYCKPHNDGIRASGGEYILCLNDDVILSPSYVEEAVKVMAHDSAIGALSGLILRPDKETIDSAGLLWSKSRKPCDRGYGKKLDKPYTKGLVFGVNGAAAFYRRQMLEAIKYKDEYFDESFGIYCEDLDIAWRAARLGWKAIYSPTSIAIHKRGATTRVRKSVVPKFLRKFSFVTLPHELKLRHVRNRYATIIKNDGLLSLLKDLPWILFYEMRLFAYLIFFDRLVFFDIVRDMQFFSVALSKRIAKK